jgi:hypothetical protein
MLRIALLVAVVCAAFAPTAHAATLTVSGGALTYTMGAGKNAVAFAGGSGGVVVTRRSGDEEPVTAVAFGCTETTAGREWVCPGVTRVTADGGSDDDILDASALGVPATLRGGDGNDHLLGGVVADSLDGADGADTLSGGTGNDNVVGGPLNDVLDAGPGDDSLEGASGDDFVGGGDGNDDVSGGEGNDELRPGAGIDVIHGGGGSDRVFYEPRSAPLFTLDGVGNDGDPGERDLIEPDVENVDASATGSGLVTITGDANANVITVGAGRGDITGGPGRDTLNGGPLDDVVHAHDGEPDWIFCGAGEDTVEIDGVDTISPTCEHLVAWGVTVSRGLDLDPAQVLDGDHDGVSDAADQCASLAGPPLRLGCPTGVLADPSIRYLPTKTGIRVLNYWVQAAKGARIVVTCSKGCTRTVATGRGSRRVPIKGLKNRLLRKGARITITVSQPGRLTLQVVDTVGAGTRRKARPRCFVPGTKAPALAC